MQPIVDILNPFQYAFLISVRALTLLSIIRSGHIFSLFKRFFKCHCQKLVYCLINQIYDRIFLLQLGDILIFIIMGCFDYTSIVVTPDKMTNK